MSSIIYTLWRIRIVLTLSFGQNGKLTEEPLGAKAVDEEQVEDDQGAYRAPESRFEPKRLTAPRISALSRTMAIDHRRLSLRLESNGSNGSLVRAGGQRRSFRPQRRHGVSDTTLN